MKLRSKLLLAAVSLLTVSVAATATSAYAWYAANRQVQASVTNVKVRSTETNITTELVPYSSPAAAATTSDESFSVDGSEAGNKADKRFTIKTTKAVSDISGIGNGTFHKPMIDVTGAKVVGWETGTGLTDNYYKFVLKFTGNGETKVGLYFSAASKFTTDTSLNVAESVRISAVVGSNQKFVMVPNDATSHTYLSSGADAAGTPLAKLAKTTITNEGQDSLVLVQNGFADVKTYDESVNTYLGTIDPSSESAKSLTVTFYVWIEGTSTALESPEITTTPSSLSADLDFYTVEYVAPVQNPGASV